MTRNVLAMVVLSSSLLLSASSVAHASPAIVSPFYFFDGFGGNSLDTTNNWDAANGVTVSGGFMHTTRSTGQIQSQAGKINYPPSPVRWGAETRFMVTNDGQ